MKKRFPVAILAFVLTAIVAVAEGVLPMFEKGRVWTVTLYEGFMFFERGDSAWFYPRSFMRHEVVGDTVIEGKKMAVIESCYTDKDGNFVGYFEHPSSYVSGRKKYGYDDGEISYFRKLYLDNVSEDLMLPGERYHYMTFPYMDFSLQKGDYLFEGAREFVTDVQTVNIMGVDRKVMRIDSSWPDANSEKVAAPEALWIEGIGSTNQSLFSKYARGQDDVFHSPSSRCYECMTPFRTRLTGCYDADGNCLIDEETLNKLLGRIKPGIYTSISEIEAEQSESQDIYDLSGRKVASPQPGKIYVKGRRLIKY